MSKTTASICLRGCLHGGGWISPRVYTWEKPALLPGTYNVYLNDTRISYTLLWLRSKKAGSARSTSILAKKTTAFIQPSKMTWRETNVGYSFAFDETKTHLRAFFNKKTTLLTHYRPLNWLKYSKIIRQGTSVKEKLTTYTEVYKSHDKYILRLFSLTFRALALRQREGPKLETEGTPSRQVLWLLSAFIYLS